MRCIEAQRLGDQVYLGKLLTLVEQDPAHALLILGGLPGPSRLVHRIGVTGSPGVGKSALLNKLIPAFRQRGGKVAVLAVDPTSPLTGGAMLGDRLRLAQATEDSGVFVRSLGSRGSLGGVTPSVAYMATILAAAGFDWVFIETVGVGQTGYDVMCLVDTVLALFSPESGDAVQMMKAGLMEVGDIFVVNKADRPGHESVLSEIKVELDARVRSTAGNPVGWLPSVLAVSATSGMGIDQVMEALDQHHSFVCSLPSNDPWRRTRIVRELAFLLRSTLNSFIEQDLQGEIDQLASEVQSGTIGTCNAVAALRARLANLL